MMIIITIKGCYIQIKHNTREDYKVGNIHVYVVANFFVLVNFHFFIAFGV